MERLVPHDTARLPSSFHTAFMTNLHPNTQPETGAPQNSVPPPIRRQRSSRQPDLLGPLLDGALSWFINLQPGK